MIRLRLRTQEGKKVESETRLPTRHIPVKCYQYLLVAFAFSKGWPFGFFAMGAYHTYGYSEL